MKVKPPINVTPQVVSSSEFSDHAKDLIVDWIEKNDPKNVHISKLRKWQASDNNHWPNIYWGSCWACDIPLYLGTVDDRDLTQAVDKLLRRDRDEWQRAIREAEKIRQSGQGD